MILFFFLDFVMSVVFVNFLKFVVIYFLILNPHSPVPLAARSKV